MFHELNLNPLNKDIYDAHENHCEDDTVEQHENSNMMNNVNEYRNGLYHGRIHIWIADEHDGLMNHRHLSKRINASVSLAY